jgi:hypothetical protein
LPIPPIVGTINAAVAAARLATDVTQRLTEAVRNSDGGAGDFDAVLQGADSKPATSNDADSKTQDADSRTQLIESARQILSGIGIGEDRSVSINVDGSGSIEVAAGDPDMMLRAAEIEAALNRPPLTDLARRWAQDTSAGRDRNGNVRIDLSQTA